MNCTKFPLGAVGLLLFVGCAQINKQTDEKSIANKQQPPKLTKPIAQRIWIEPQVLENGSVYIDGHWKYIIQKESSWTK